MPAASIWDDDGLVDKLVWVTTEGQTYLCRLVEKNGPVLELACCLGRKREGCDVKPLFCSWLTDLNLGQLETVTIGTAGHYTVRPLSVDDKRMFRREWEDMKEAKRTALRRLENQFFLK